MSLQAAIAKTAKYGHPFQVMHPKKTCFQCRKSLSVGTSVHRDDTEFYCLEHGDAGNVGGAPKSAAPTPSTLDESRALLLELREMVQVLIDRG